MIGNGVLLRPWRSDVLQAPRVARADSGEVPAGVEQTQASVRAAAHAAGVVVVLAVVVPEAHRADLVVATPLQREEAAARARMRPSLRPSPHIDERPLFIRHHDGQPGTPVTRTRSRR